MARVKWDRFLGLRDTAGVAAVCVPVLAAYLRSVCSQTDVLSSQCAVLPDNLRRSSKLNESKESVDPIGSVLGSTGYGVLAKYQRVQWCHRCPALSGLRTG